MFEMNHISVEMETDDQTKSVVINGVEIIIQDISISKPMHQIAEVTLRFPATVDWISAREEVPK